MDGLGITLEHLTYGVIGFMVLFGAVTVVLMKLDILKFGKNDKPKPAPCDDCAERIAAGTNASSDILRIEIGHLKTDVTAIKESQAALWKRTDKMADDVSFIRGWLSNNGRPGGRRSYDPA